MFTPFYQMLMRSRLGVNKPIGAGLPAESPMSPYGMPKFPGAQLPNESPWSPIGGATLPQESPMSPSGGYLPQENPWEPQKPKQQQSGMGGYKTPWSRF